MAAKVKPSALFLFIVTLTSVAAQTFQYSHGWTNGKRDGNTYYEYTKEVANKLDRLLSPCQINKLKYVLEGKPLNKQLLIPCDDLQDDESHIKGYRSIRSQEPLFEAFL